MLKMGKKFTFAYGQGRVELTPSPLTVSLTVKYLFFTTLIMISSNFKMMTFAGGRNLRGQF